MRFRRGGLRRRGGAVPPRLVPGERQGADRVAAGAGGIADEPKVFMLGKPGTLEQAVFRFWAWSSEP